MNDWISDLYFVMPHADGTRVLSQAGQLPHLRLAKRVQWTDIESFLPEIRAALGDVIVLRCLKYERDKLTQRVSAVYELEALREAQGNWLEPGGLGGLTSGLDEIVRAALSETDAEARSPWARRGWFAEATSWIKTQITGVERVEQVKNVGISCVLRVCARTENFYFKVATKRALFADEPRVTRRLAERFPELIPRPVAVDSTRGWMILPDIGTNLRDAPVGLPEWTQLMADYAHVQRELVSDGEWLLNAGCLDRRTDLSTDRRPVILETQLRALLEDDSKPGGLALADLEVLRGLRDVSLRHLAVVNGSRIPNSLVHGDWHPGNVAVRNGKIRIFDWTDACLSHPFFDALPMIDELAAFFDATALESLLDTYLETWSAFAPLEALKAELPSFRVAVCLHQLVTCAKILEGLEPSARHELAQGLQYWLGRLVELIRIPENSSKNFLPS